MRDRIVPPAILCVIATYPVWAFTGWLVAVGILYGSVGFLLLFYLAEELLVPGFLIVGLTIALLVDRDHHQIWGALVAALYGLASIYSFLIFYAVLSGTGIGSFPVWIALAAAASPPLGLVGAIWSIAWKPTREEKNPDNKMWNIPPPLSPQPFVMC